MEKSRASNPEDFEVDAEVLVAYQLDLVAQLECQLRAVHHTMRQIEQLRSGTRRVGPELPNGGKVKTLNHLTDELTAIDQELTRQHESCLEMLRTVGKMRDTLRAKKVVSTSPSPSDDSESPNQPPA
jgi:hypothetical protein